MSREYPSHRAQKRKVKKERKESASKLPKVTQYFSQAKSNLQQESELNNETNNKSASVQCEVNNAVINNADADILVVSTPGNSESRAKYWRIIVDSIPDISHVQNGSVRRVTDEQVRALALELAGTNVSTVYVCCPKNPKQSLGIYMPYLVMIIKSLKKYFTFEVTILDDRNVHRRFRMSNFQKANQIHHFCTSMPLCLNPGWNEIYFDLADFTRKAYKTNYVETTRIQIHANCRIRVIYFCDRIYQDKDIPQKFKIFLPNNHVCRKKSAEKAVEEKESVLIASSDLEAEYRSFEDEEEEQEEASYSDEGLTHSGVIEQVFEQQTMLASGEGEEYESAPITPIEEEEEDEAEKEEKEGEETEEADAEHEELVVVKTEVEMKTEPQEVEVKEEPQEVEVKQEQEELEAKEESEEADEDEHAENDVVEG